MEIIYRLMNIVQANDEYGDYVLVPLTNDENLMAMVSPIDAKWALNTNWQVSTGGYIARGKWKKGFNTSESIKLHLEVAKLTGVWEEGFLVDHKNRNKLDCRRANLRKATKSQNAANTEYSTGISQYKGVSFRTDKTWSAWRAYIKVNYEFIDLGSYDTEENAAIAYDLAAIEYFGEFSCTNFPKENYEGMTFSGFVKAYKGNRFSSSYRGITKNKQKGRWTGNAEKLGKRVYLGSYESEELASRAYDLCRICEFGETTRLNHPLEDYPDGLFDGRNFIEFKDKFGIAPGGFSRKKAA
jgi:hypothetical protein